LETIQEIEANLRAHEAMCEERWKTIFERVDRNADHLQRIENRMMAMGGAIILFLLTILAQAHL
tara:strand:+ start:132 stop:323 length:192 start_codon:yes stop_codon:yes gene_type:complete